MSSNIALNFFPLETERFNVTLYRIPYTEGNRPECEEEEAVKRNLEINGSRDNYWTLFQKIEGSTKEVCESSNNVYLTIAALRVALIRSCEKKVDEGRLIIRTKFRRHVEIVTNEYQEGSRVILVEPYYLRSCRQYGFLAEPRFRAKPEYVGTRRARLLSLADDERGKANLNYYADRYTLLAAFVRDYHDKIFPLEIPGGEIVQVASHFVKLPAESLKVKRYVVSRETESPSQFMGVKKSGPFRGALKNVNLYFVYREEDHALSQHLYRALHGDVFTTFPGMDKMFNVPISRDNVSGMVISDFTFAAIERLRDRIAIDAADRNVVPIILTPFSKFDDPEKNASYWRLKHAFLAEGLPIQVVSTKTVADRNELKWATSNIGLQIFAKLGGIPWKVKPRLTKCLIVGIGQAHQKTDRGIERFFAYSVLTDSSGIFEEVRVLGDESNERDYISNFGESLRQIFDEYSSRYSSFVVHSTFAIRREELETIASILNENKNRLQNGEFVSLKFSEKHRFFGFSTQHNSRVPHESTIVRLSKSEYIVWFEGLQYGQMALGRRVANPLYIQFTYPDEELSAEQRKAHLQDAINLSGANWRGFNAKSLPVSVYYAQLIARYLKGFNHHRFPPIDVNLFKPWFL
ncbi:MAG: Piwi domain-containing protein [Bacteroidota bacterium]|nr:Piwi domain-containing protein [Bacteroidota bacterium]